MHRLYGLRPKNCIPALCSFGGAQEAVRNFWPRIMWRADPFKDVALGRVTRLVLVDVQEPDRLGPLSAPPRGDVEKRTSTTTMEPVRLPEQPSGHPDRPATGQTRRGHHDLCWSSN